MDHPSARQREFKLSLLLFSQRLRATGLSSEALVRCIGHLAALADHAPAALALMGRDHGLVLRIADALGRVPNPHSLTPNPSDEDRLANPGASQLPAAEPRVDHHQAVVMPDPGALALQEHANTRHNHTVVSMWHTMDEARTVQTDAILLRADPAKGGGQDGPTPAPDASDGAPWVAVVPLHPGAWPLGSGSAARGAHAMQCAIAQYPAGALQGVRHCLCLVDTADLDRASQTQVLRRHVAHALREGKTVWLALCQLDAGQRYRTESLEIAQADLAACACGEGLGLGPEHIFWISAPPGQWIARAGMPLPIQALLAGHSAQAWRDHMQFAIAQLRTATLDALEHMENPGPQVAAPSATTPPRARALAQSDQQSFADPVRRITTAPDLRALQEAQTTLYAKALSMLDSANETTWRPQPGVRGVGPQNVEQLRQLITHFFDHAHQCLDQVKALLEAAAAALHTRLLSTQRRNADDVAWVQAPNLQQQTQRLTQHRRRTLGDPETWRTFSPRQAYARVQNAQTAIDATLESSRALASQWHRQIVARIGQLGPMDPTASAPSQRLPAFSRDAKPLLFSPSASDQQDADPRAMLEAHIALLLEIAIDAYPGHEYPHAIGPKGLGLPPLFAYPPATRNRASEASTEVAPWAVHAPSSITSSFIHKTFK